MEKNSKAVIFAVVFILLSACNNRNVVVEYYEGSKQIKEQRQFYYDNDTSNYEYTSFYMNGQMRNQGMIVYSRREGVWKEWYGDGMLHRELYYTEGELDVKNEQRKLPEIIFEADTLFVDTETRMKVLNIYPDELMPFVGLYMRSLPNDSCYDFVIMPSSTDSAIIFYFSPVLLERTDTVYLKDISDPKQYGLTDEEFERLKDVNPDFKIINEVAKMLAIKKMPVYERGEK